MFFWDIVYMDIYGSVWNRGIQPVVDSGMAIDGPTVLLYEAYSRKPHGTCMWHIVASKGSFYITLQSLHDKALNKKKLAIKATTLPYHLLWSDKPDGFLPISRGTGADKLEKKNFIIKEKRLRWLGEPGSCILRMDNDRISK